MSALILIADGDAERGRRIAEACTARGLACRVTTHGAAALEAALSEVPQVLVGQLGLPLIDSPKLAAILHANPRTQGVAVLFVGDRPGDAERRGLGRPADPAAGRSRRGGGLRADGVGRARLRGARRPRPRARRAAWKGSSRSSRSPICSSSST